MTPGHTYAVTCTVDASDVFSYRKVTLTLQGSRDASDTSFARKLSSSGEECQPVRLTISNIPFATAAAANWQLLSQNMGIDGLTDSLGQATGNWRKPPYAFPNSRNPLKDSLGLVAALVVSRVNNSGRYVPAEESTGEYAYVQATKIRNGKTRDLTPSYSASCDNKSSSSFSWLWVSGANRLIMTLESLLHPVTGKI